MKYALFDFVEDCSVEVGESAWIEDLEDCDDFDFDEECIVAWPTKKGGRSTRYGAKVIKFSDDRTELVRLANLYTKKGEDTDLRTPELGRGKREKRARRLSSDSEDDEEETVVNTKSQKRRKQVQKKASAQLLDRIQKEKKTSHLQKRVDSDLGSLGCTVLSRPSDSSSDDNSENRLLRKKVKNLEEENAALRNSLKIFKGLPGFLKKMQELTDNVPNNNEISSVRSSSPSSDERRPEEISTQIISERQIARCNKTSSKKYTYDLMTAVFGKEVMRTHSYSGRKCNAISGSIAKPVLDADKVNAIKDLVCQKFSCADSEVIGHIKNKLYAEAKSRQPVPEPTSPQ